MPEPSASADPDIKSVILRGVFEQNRAMAEPVRPRRSGRRPAPRPSPIPSVVRPQRHLMPLLLVWLLLAALPGNTGFLAISTLGGASAPLPVDVGAAAAVLAGDARGDDGRGRSAVAAGAVLEEGGANGAALSLDLSLPESLLSPAQLPGVESLSALESAPEPVHDPPPFEELLVPPGADEYLKSPVGERGGYVSLFSQTELPISALFGLKVQNIVIDPGHGGHDPGAIGLGGHREKDVTLDIALRLQHRLSRHPQYRVLLTRDRDVKMSLKERVAFAAEQGADLFVSIHVNALPEQPVNLVETYYFGPSADDRSLELAEQENRGSDYAVADFQSLIQKIGNTLKTQESRQLAADVQAALVSNFRQQEGRIIDAGIKTAPFVVLLGVDVPSVLAEVSCISNADEERRLATGEHRSGIAAAIERGIIRYLEKKSNNRLTADGESSDGAEKDQNG
jgi:N-acetylmuramoyl-L-alanine amidase